MGPSIKLVNTAGWTMLLRTLTGLGKVRPPIVVRRVGPTPALQNLLQIPIVPSPKSNLHCLPLHLCDQTTFLQHQAAPPQILPCRHTSIHVARVPTLVFLIVARSTQRLGFQ